MSETRDYLDSFARTTADVRIATVESRNDDGTYMLRYVDTQALDRAAKANPIDEFSLGSRVIVQMPSGSRTVIGSNPVIVSRAPREQRGLSATTPTATRNVYERASITGVDPDPLILERGGAAAEQVIMGFGLTTAATYEASTGDDPALTNSSAPVVTPTKVTMNIGADSDSPLGEFNVKIGNTIAKRALRIVEPALPAASLWYWNTDLDLVRVNSNTGAVLGTWSPLGGTREGAIVTDGTTIYAMTDSHLLKVPVAGGAATSFALSGPAADRGAVVTATHIYYQRGRPAGDSSSLQTLVVVKCDLNGQNDTLITLSVTNRRYISVTMRLVGGVIFASTPISASNTGLLYSLDTADDSFVLKAAESAQLWTAEVVGDHMLVHTGAGGTARVRRYLWPAMTFDSQQNYPEPVLSDGGAGYSCADADRAFIAVPNSGGAILLVVTADPLAVQSVSLPDIGTDPNGVALDDSFLYVLAGTVDKVQKVSLADLSVTAIDAPRGFAGSSGSAGSPLVVT